MNLVKTISTSVNNLSQRVIKFFRFGKDDVQTALEYGPYGIDSNPVKDMIALYAPTTDKGETVIVGYLNKNQKAAPGEMRIFATDANAVEKFYIWMLANGTIEIGGTANYAVKFNELKTAFNSLQTSYNNFLIEYKLHVHTGGTISGSTGPTVSVQTPNAANIDTAKNANIKTI